MGNRQVHRHVEKSNAALTTTPTQGEVMISFESKKKKPRRRPKPLSKTYFRLRELRGVRLADFLRAAADITERLYTGGFQSNKSNGWVVTVGNRTFAHRMLIARAIWYASQRSGETPKILSTEDFEGSGAEYKTVLRGNFGLTITELPETSPSVTPTRRR